MGGRGSSNPGGGSRKLRMALKSIEDRIRGNPTESAIALDDDGNVLFDTSDGKGQEVNISVQQQRLAYGKTMTHNHPHGYYLSDADVNIATMLSLKQLRATTPDGRAFVLEKTQSGQADGSFLRAYQQAIRSTASQAANNAYDPALSMQEFNHRASLEHTKIVNQWLKDHAPEYGYRFREEGRKRK